MGARFVAGVIDMVVLAVVVGDLVAWVVIGYLLAFMIGRSFGSGEGADPWFEVPEPRRASGATPAAKVPSGSVELAG